MYYLGDNGNLPVKPVTRRLTRTRGQAPQRTKRYLQRPGRRPLNRRAYPTMGTPLAVNLSMQPGQFAGTPDDAFSMKGLNPIGRASRGPVLIAAQTRSGRRILTRPYDPFSPVALGASILDPMSLVTSFTPSIPTTTTAPAQADSGGFLNTLLTGAMSLWDSRPQVLKDISLKVDPNVAMAAAQRLVSAGQVTQAVNYLRSVGINPSYLGVPVTGQMAGAGYQFAGFNMSSLTQYLPWIIGGGVLLFALPMVMGRK